MFPIKIDASQMRPTIPEWYNDVCAVCRSGYQWWSFVGTPIKGTENYPERQRVRQLMSPEQLANRHWKSFFEKNEGRIATGDEPLSYTYCSSVFSGELTPDILDGLVEKLVKVAKCDHKIGHKLVSIIRSHLMEAIGQQ